MKWFVFVIFVVNQPSDPNAYLFTTPSFNSQQQCQMAVMDLRTIPLFADKLVQEFGGPKPIKSISCINEDTVRKLDEWAEGKST